MEKICVRCGVPMTIGMVPCPDARRGFSCLVLHWGPRCERCGGYVYERAEGAPA